MKKEWKEASFFELDIVETASVADWMPYGVAMSGMNTIPVETENDDNGNKKPHKGNNGNHFGHYK